jgi:hypothetical protein
MANKIRILNEDDSVFSEFEVTDEELRDLQREARKTGKTVEQVCHDRIMARADAVNTALTCFMCKERPGTNYTTYDCSVGFFPIGGEPRTCDPCKHTFQAMSDMDRRALFLGAGFEFSAEPPSGANDVLGDCRAREAELKSRGKA